MEVRLLLNVIYVSFVNINAKEMIGVNNKITWQVNAMRELGHYVIHGYYKNNTYVFSNGQVEEEILINTKNKLSIRKSIYKALEALIIKEQPDLIYIRFAGCDNYFISLLKKIKPFTKKIIIEIPTYPILKEKYSLLQTFIKNKQLKPIIGTIIKILLIIFNSHKIKKYVDSIVTYMDYKTIWGIPVIKIDNGVCVDKIPMKKGSNNTNEIVLIGVANVSHWHGYDRIIEGIYNYSNERQENTYTIRFKIVGHGPEIERLKHLVQKYSLNEYVEFHGTQTGENLNLLFDSSDIAVSSLGMHRIGLVQGSTLKTKEYCARGIPFIYSYKEKEISEDLPFAMLLPSDDSYVDINSVINFVNMVREDKLIGEKMRKFAYEHYDWKKQMEIIFSHL
jgi:glycosyltransferase involved in cell wall biosynthesis